MKKILVRVLTCVLCIAVVLGVSPTVFAIEPIQANEVSFLINPPVGTQKNDFDIMHYNDCVSITNVEWLHSDGTKVDNDEIIIVGNTYICAISFETTYGYILPENPNDLTVTINNDKVGEIDTDTYTQEFAYVTCEFEAGSPAFIIQPCYKGAGNNGTVRYDWSVNFEVVKYLLIYNKGTDDVPDNVTMELDYVGYADLPKYVTSYPCVIAAYYGTGEDEYVISEQFTVVSLPETTQTGDIDGDNEVSSSDALMALQYSVGKLQRLSALQFFVADVSGDNSITSNDALLILQFAVGKISGFGA